MTSFLVNLEFLDFLEPTFRSFLSLELVVRHQFKNIELSFFASFIKGSFPLFIFTLIDTVRLFDTLLVMLQQHYVQLQYHLSFHAKLSVKKRIFLLLSRKRGGVVFFMYSSTTIEKPSRPFQYAYWVLYWSPFMTDRAKLLSSIQITLL